MFTLGSLVRTAKRHAFNPSISDEAFLNAFLEPYIRAGRVKRRKGLPFELDKHRTSEIINNKCDVPVDLRKAISRYGLEEETAKNFELFFMDTMDLSWFDVFVDDVYNLLDLNSTSDGILFDQLSGLSDDPQKWIARALIAAIRADNRETNECELWHCGTGSLCIRKGDIFNNCFGKKSGLRRIVVVPVNSTFDTTITWGYESNNRPVVSEKTIHGQWIKRMTASGVSADKLDLLIAEDLRTQGITPLQHCVQKSNLCAEYPLGTIAKVNGSRATFFLLAISAFDRNNNAQSSMDQVRFSIECLIDFYDKYGQGYDITIPLIGTGMSRAALSHQDSYNLLVDVFTSNKLRIHGRVEIVVRAEDIKRIKL